MDPVYVIGVGMGRFGKFPDRSLKDLGREALDALFADADIPATSIEVAYMANSVAGIVTGQEAIRGQTILHAYGLGEIPVFNIENACASSSSAAHLAWQSVASGAADNVLVLGVEKLHHEDRSVSYRALGSAVDVEEHRRSEGSPFLQHAADAAEAFLNEIGGDERTLAEIASKSHFHSSFNPYAQYQDPYSVDEILASPKVAGILTRLMCAPIGDGAAGLIFSRRPPSGSPVIRVAGTAVGSARAKDTEVPPIAWRVSTRAYKAAGLTAADVDVVELHDTTAFNELRLYEQLSLIARDELADAVASQRTRLGGRPVVNPSGGLVSRGHPVGATGAGQLVELAWQLRGQAGGRQVEDATVALAQNGGGRVGSETAALAVTLLERVG